MMGSVCGGMKLIAFSFLAFLNTGNEFCERLAYYGMSSNLVLYFKHKLHQSTATASKNVLNWSGTCYITPLIGAFLADAYLGRYWTIASFSIIYVIVSSVLQEILYSVYSEVYLARNHLGLLWIESN